MTILCAVAGLLQVVTLLILTGFLFSLAAVTRLMELTVSIIYPVTIFILRQSSKLVVFESVLADLCGKFPCLQYILRPEYAPYLNTAGTVLLGWLIVSWMSYVIWTLLAPVTMGVAAIFLICPATAKWCLKQIVPDLEGTFNDFLEKRNMSSRPI